MGKETFRERCTGSQHWPALVCALISNLPLIAVSGTGIQFGHSSCSNYFCLHLYVHVIFTCQSAEQYKRCGHTEVLQKQEHNAKNVDISVTLTVLGYKLLNLYV